MTHTKNKIAVWDTYIRRENGQLMHFDILVPKEINDREIVLNYGMNYLKGKQIETESIRVSQCNFCHVESPTQQMMNDIHSDGYSIIELSNCN